MAAARCSHASQQHHQLLLLLRPPPLPRRAAQRGRWRRATAAAPAAAQAAAAAAAAVGVLQVPPAQLAQIAAAPVVEVAALAAAGAACARAGLLPTQGRRLVSSLVFNVFTPALLFSNLGRSLPVGSFQHASELWPLAANMLALHTAGLGLGLAQARLLGLSSSSSSERGVAVCLTALGNVGNWPLVAAPALLRQPGVLALLSAASGDGGGGGGADVAAAVAAASDEATLYVMVGFFVAALIQFPVGYLLLQRTPDEEAAAQPRAPAVAVGADAAALSVAVAAAPGAAAASGPVQPVLQGAVQQQQQQPPGAAGRLRVVARGVFTPPVIACLLSIPVAAVPVLHDALFTPSGRLSVLGDAVQQLGAPLIPCLFLVLGADLADGPGRAKVPARLVLSLCCSKLVLHPLLGLGACLTALHAGLLPASTSPLQLLVMLLVWSTPAAVLVHSLATMLGNNEAAVSTVLYWQYMASLVTLPVCLVVYLQLLQAGMLSTAMS